MTYTFVDFETTGLDYKKDQVIEIGAIRVSESGQEFGRFHTMVTLNEGQILDEEITNITGINEDDLIFGANEQEALTALRYFIGDTIVVAQFASFDLSFLSRWKGYSEYPVREFICTRTMAKLWEPDKSASLRHVCARLNVEHKQQHRAMGDVSATVGVFFKLKDILMNTKMMGVDEYINVMLNSSERPLRYIPQGAKVIVESH